jgi:hypothetical protein
MMVMQATYSWGGSVLSYLHEGESKVAMTEDICPAKTRKFRCHHNANHPESQKVTMSSYNIPVLSCFLIFSYDTG